jgi:mitochondrial fission protein ELM1
VLEMHGRHKKFAAFHQELNQRGVARPFIGALETVSYSPLDETNRAARELLRRFDAR